MPSNAAAANALYNTNAAYKEQLELLWALIPPPTLTILGTSSGSILEQVPGSPTPSTLSFQVTVSDALTVSPNTIINAWSPYGTVTAGPISSGGTSTVTLTLKPGLQANGGQDFVLGSIPIVLTTTDGAGVVSAAQTFTANVTPVDPAPTFTSVPGSVTFNEGSTPTALGSLTGLTFAVDDLTPTGSDDAGAVTITATSSNSILTPNSDIVISPTSTPGHYNLAIYSQPGGSGSETITLTANDGTKTTTATIPVTVNEVAVTPVISVASSETYNETSSAGTFIFHSTSLARTSFQRLQRPRDRMRGGLRQQL